MDTHKQYWIHIPAYDGGDDPKTAYKAWTRELAYYGGRWHTRMAGSPKLGKAVADHRAKKMVEDARKLGRLEIRAR